MEVWGPRKKDGSSGISHIDEQNRPRLVACSVSCTWLLMIYFKCWWNYNPVVDFWSLFINLGSTCGWQVASIIPWLPPPYDSAQIRHFNFKFELASEWKPFSSSLLSSPFYLHNPLPTSNLSASKFWVELGARFSFSLGKESTSSKKREKKGEGVKGKI